MSLNRIVAHVEDEITTKVAEHAATKGMTFDESLAAHVTCAAQVFEAAAEDGSETGL